MSRQLSGQLSPSLLFKSPHSVGLSFFFTRNVFTPNQLFKFEKKITGFMLISNKDRNYY